MTSAVTPERSSESTLLVAAAVERELAPFLELAPALPPRSWRAAVTGPGKINAALGVSRALREARTGSVLFLGCAGAFPASGLRIGDVVIAREEILADEGAEAPEGFLSLEDLGLPLATRDGRSLFNRVPVSVPAAGEIEALRAPFSGSFRLALGRLITVSAASGTDSRAATMASRWDPVAESMEGAAAAAVAWRNAVPILEIRGISNFTGDRDRASWDIETACERAAAVAARWIELKTRRRLADC
jgi:futalosine hydrolase